MKVEIIRKIKPRLNNEEVSIIEKAMDIIEEIQKILEDNNCDTIEDGVGYDTRSDRLEEALDILNIVKNMEEMY